MMARRAVCVCLVLAFVLLSSLPGRASLSSTYALQGQSWTIMVYMADDTTSSLNWQDDLNEMEAAQESDDVNIIALVDPYGPNNSKIYKVTHDLNLYDPTIVSAEVDDGGLVIAGDEVDMSLPLTLQSFVEFGASAYPADNSVLILWGHGAGWVGLCPDGTDLLTLPDLSQALDGAKGTTGRPLDLVIVDSCAEATMETLWQLHESVRFFVGSEKDVPFQGLPYDTVVGNLAEDVGQSVQGFARSIADEYVLWSGANTDYSVTMGVFDLSKMDSLIGSLEELSNKGAKYDPIFHETMKVALGNSETYEEEFSVDYQHFAWQLQNADLPLEVRYAAYQSMMAAREVILHFTKYENPAPVNGVGAEFASGFTIHPPSDDTPETAYANISLASTTWLSFGRLLRGDTMTVANGQGPSISYSSVEEPNDTAVITWPDGTQYGTIWIFRNQTSGLSLVSAVNTSDQVYSVRVPGSYTLATSYFMNGTLASYRTLNITTSGTVDIDVMLFREGEVVGNDEGYEVSVVTEEGLEVHSSATPPTDNINRMSLTIPDNASIGDSITIRVIDGANGKLVVTKSVFVPDPSADAVFAVEVVGSCGCPYQAAVPLFFAVLPGLLILAFALSLHYSAKHRKDEPDEPD